MRNTTLFLAVLFGFSGVANADTGRITERDDCISNLRGHAEMNAAKQGYTVLKIDQGEYATTEDGGVKCSAQFLIEKDGKEAFSQVYSGQVAKLSK
ncbi:hypothetical protein [Pseudomonas sp. GXZC]|uniref:hypothetical protein n=1 Tax=Pseudomonas sp. GXZC TaxID=3003351 RepID=UPI0022AAA26E|nr:hypothetical protein [Pseudomonas sp. GXZC]WAT32288.1 hypothetical protein OZ428_33975 [Pseudomonas sp. GXZC]